MLGDEPVGEGQLMRDWWRGWDLGQVWVRVRPGTGLSVLDSCSEIPQSRGLPEKEARR